MHFSTASGIVCWLLSLSGVLAIPAATGDAVDQLSADSLAKLKTYKASKPATTGCTIETAYVRREWTELSTDQRKQYIAAVLCLTKKPSITPSKIAPGARSRYDDFVYTHINQTQKIHSTANFLTWHRYFVYTYEQALRNECNYTGYQPYWNWGKYASDPIHSAIFDGSDTSMGGNGSPAGQCVTTGPFKDMKSNLGPKSATVSNVPANPQSDGLGYNPRCLRRDVSVQNAKGTATSYIMQLLTASRNNAILPFQNEMQGYFPDGTLGVHGGGHFTIGGDPGGDFYNSPGDPAFWLHHGMIDRVYWIWQNQGLPNRLSTIAGTITMSNNPSSRDGTLDDLQDLWPNALGIKIRDLMSTTDGPFCYVYS